MDILILTAMKSADLEHATGHPPSTMQNTFQGIKFGTNDFVVRLSVMQNQYLHKRRIVRTKTVIVCQKIQKDVFRLISLFLGNKHVL